MTGLDDALTTRETAVRLGKSVRTVHRMVRTGRLPATRFPGYKGALVFEADVVERLRQELADESPTVDEASESPPTAAARAS